MKKSFLYRVLKKPFTGKDGELNRVVIDSREVIPGDVFVAIKGERFDGHDFVPAALKEGAAAVIVDRPGAFGPQALEVADTARALGELAHAWRREINPYVIGITGSNGKTTVKELVALVLRENFGAAHVLATTGNLNNHLGVPLTLLRLTPAHRFAVIEMGMNHAGEMAYLTHIAAPNVALVNNVLRAHIGCGFADLAAVAAAKGEIFQGLSAGDLAVLPRESSEYAVLKKLAGEKRQVTFGLTAKDADFFATRVTTEALVSTFFAHTPQGVVRVHLPLPGRHNIANALAVFAALADRKELPITAIAKALTKAQTEPGRLTPRPFHYGLLLDDTYNANPDSMKAAIAILSELAGDKVLVLGDMAELGENSVKMHQEIGSYAKEKGIDRVFAVGRETQKTAAAFGPGGEFFADKKALIKRLKTVLRPNSVVLVKGSRCMRMEEICRALLVLK